MAIDAGPSSVPVRASGVAPVVWFIVGAIAFIQVLVAPLGGTVVAGVAVGWTWGARFSDSRYQAARWVALLALLANLLALLLAIPVTSEIGIVEITEVPLR